MFCFVLIAVLTKHISDFGWKTEKPHIKQESREKKGKVKKVGFEIDYKALLRFVDLIQRQKKR